MDVEVGSGVGTGVEVGVGVGVRAVTIKSQMVGDPPSGESVQFSPPSEPVTLPPTWFASVAVANPDRTAVYVLTTSVEEAVTPKVVVPVRLVPVNLPYALVLLTMTL